MRIDLSEPRITNPRSASNHEKSQSNFFTLPLLCHNLTSYGKMNPVTWDETNGYEATRIYRENAVATVSAVVRVQDGACMAGLKGKSGPPGNMNAFKHGLAAIQKRREDGIPTEHEGRMLGSRFWMD